MERFHNKVLLVLGTNVGSIDIVKYARANGAYVIVTDNLPPALSPAKGYANEYADISTADIEALKKLIIEKKVSGVLAGVSEFNLLKAMELCDYFNFPFYCNRHQWELIEHKDMFRQLCINFGVPCPKTYYIGNHLTLDIIKGIKFPVILKPVDCGASVGVSICNTRKELTCAEQCAIKESSEGKIIVEEFFEGIEFTAHYTISNGKATLSCIDNRYPVAVNSGNVTTIPIARFYPSSLLNEYLDQVNDSMIRLCESINLNTGVIFIQGLYNKRRNKFAIFEAGLRCAGEAPYRIIEKINGNNFMNSIVDYALLGKSDSINPTKEDPTMKGKICGVVSLVSKGGIVGKISGIEDVMKHLKSVYDYECRYAVGSKVPNGNTLRQIMIRFVLINDTTQKMIEDIKYINNHVAVLDNDGHNMCMYFDPQRLTTEF